MTGVDYARHRAGADKPECVRVKYTVRGSKPVLEFWCPDHRGWAGSRWRTEFAPMLGSAADSVDECEEEWEYWPVPVYIETRRDRKTGYERVVKRRYLDPEEMH